MRVFNYKKDIGNIVVTPEIRCRFMLEPPDKEREFHYHEGAGEVFLVLEGRVEFTIEKETLIANAGEFVYVPPYYKHTLCALDGEPAYIYLSVAPHKEPTHTYFDSEGNPKPVYGGWRSVGMPDDARSEGC